MTLLNKFVFAGLSDGLEDLKKTSPSVSSICADLTNLSYISFSEKVSHNVYVLLPNLRSNKTREKTKFKTFKTLSKLAILLLI
jgi:hypothetical protein